MLQAQVSACTARISHLSFRLRATLDALDDIQNAHAAEVADMQQAYDSLAGRASRWKQMAAEVERERDAMRDAVELLITKGTPLGSGVRIASSLSSQLKVTMTFRNGHILESDSLHFPVSQPLCPLPTIRGQPQGLQTQLNPCRQLLFPP